MSAALQPNAHEMFIWDSFTKPTKIERDEFVDIVIGASERYGHNYDTAIASILIGDFFVENYGAPPKITLKTSPLIVAEYSEELARVSIILGAKLHEDHGFHSVGETIQILNNRLAGEMETVVFMTIINKQALPRPHIIGKLMKVFNKTHLSIHPILYWEITRDICKYPQVLRSSPNSIYLAIVFLLWSGKLHANIIATKCRFKRLVSALCYNCDANDADVLNAYISVIGSKIESDNMID